MNTKNRIEIDDDDARGPSARMRWLGAGLVLAMLGGLVWQAIEAGRASESRVAEETVESLADPQRVDGLATVDDARLGNQPVASMMAALHAEPASLPMAADETEVCGLGRVKADERGQPRDMAPVRGAAQRLREQVLPMLLNAGDDTLRAAGLLMVAAGEGSGGAVDDKRARARDELASLAAFKGSPLVYAWALRACQRQRGEGVCRMLSSDQWARLEPSNALAWLNVAADATVRRDEPAVAEAMYRVSQSARSDARFGLLASTVLAKLPPEADLLSRVGLAAELLKVDTSAELPLVAASQYCGPGDVLDANRRQVCAAVAEVLNRRGSTLGEAVLGASIGKRSGWPPERVAVASEERDALAQVAQVEPARDPWSCNALAQDLARFNDIGRLGELASMRSALERSPEGVSTLAKRYRDEMATRVASAASAVVTPP